MASPQLDRRRFLTMMGAASGAVLLGACGGDSEPPANTKAGTGPFTSNVTELRTGYDNPNYGHHIADIVAWEKGWLRDVGITGFDNRIVNDSTVAIIGRGLDWTAADTDAIIPAVVEEGVDVVWLGTRRDSEDLIFGLAPGYTIERLVEENGYVSGGEVGTRNEELGKQMLTELGVDPENQVRWVAMGGGSDTRLAALMNGQLKGSNLQIRHISMLEEAGGTIAFRENRKVAQDGYVVQTAFLEQNRDAVVAYLYALIKAKQYIYDQSTKNEVIKMLEKHDFEMTQEFIDTYQENNANLSPDNGFEIEDMELIWEELGQTGEADPNIDWRSAVNLEPLWEAQEAAGLPRRPASL